MEITSVTQQELIQTLAKYLVTQCGAQITDFRSLELEDVSALYAGFIRQKSVSYLPIEFASMFDFLNENATILAPGAIQLVSKQPLSDVEAIYSVNITKGDVDCVIVLGEDFFTQLLTEEDLATENIVLLFELFIEQLLKGEKEMTENKILEFRQFDNEDHEKKAEIFSGMPHQDTVDDERVIDLTTYIPVDASSDEEEIIEETIEEETIEEEFEDAESPIFAEELAVLSTLVTALFKSVSGENRDIVKGIRADLLELEVAVEEQEDWKWQANYINLRVLALELDELNEIQAQRSVAFQLTYIIHMFD